MSLTVLLVDPGKEPKGPGGAEGRLRVGRPLGKASEGPSELGRPQQARIAHLVVHVKPLRMVVQFLSLQGHPRHEAKSL